MQLDANEWPARLVITVDETDFFRRVSEKTGRPGPPLLPVKNELYKTVRRYPKRKPGARRASKKKVAIKILTDRHEHFRRRLQSICAGLYVSPWAYSLRVQVWVLRSKGREVAGQVFPAPDNDSCLAGVKDAIQHAGVLLDDAQIVDDTISTRFAERVGMRIELEAAHGWDG